MLRFSGAGVSDVGLVREHNEDSGFVGPYVALVADGVGGAAAGEIASATAAYVVSATALARFGEAPETIVREAVAAARTVLRRGVLEEDSRTGMATTLSVLVCDGRRVLLGHLGDSRAYLFRDGTLHQVSRDHTYVQGLVDEGRLSRDEVPSHPWRNVVLRSLDGSPGAEPAEADLVDVDARPGDRMLLCSDGLTDLVRGGPHRRRAASCRTRCPRPGCSPSRRCAPGDATTSRAWSSTWSTGRWSSGTGTCSVPSGMSPTSWTPAPSALG